MNDTVISFIRTWVPMAAGVALTWLADVLGIAIDESTSATVVAAVVGVLSAVWYALARFLEQKFPWAGWLLGVNKAPAYSAE